MEAGALSTGLVLLAWFMFLAISTSGSQLANCASHYGSKKGKNKGGEIKLYSSPFSVGSFVQSMPEETTKSTRELVVVVSESIAKSSISE